ncbi:UDP-glucose:glycoprotein glucosyltransferase [Phaffia rhodozyma]|uniref:UDP-glucose:glycoprotein glucosyltransferase n=1 Tax=Phaffia rhodozyma TaxID=264483 RepID=A0A0F7SQQ6_PHARH|nr:UDP-glucose:glycoprotein glucosyltransferase [Phaffia rhodozyma]
MRLSLALLMTCTVVVAAQKHVNLQLETVWQDHPFLFSILEQTSLNSPEAYLPILTHLSQRPDFPILAANSTALYHAAHALLPNYLHPSQIPAWDLGLAAGESAPAVEALLSVHQMLVDPEMNDCGAWVEWNGKRGCGPDGAVEVLGLGKGKEGINWDESINSTIRSYPFDHLLCLNIDSTLPPLTLYFAPSSTLFPPLLHLLQSFPELPLLVRYRMDPPLVSDLEGSSQATFVPVKKQKGVPVQGWGVEMVLKKMEYSSVDDRQDNVFNEEQIKEKRIIPEEDPILTEALGNDPWRENATPLNEVELTQLPFATASLILSHPSPLVALELLSQSFPLFTNALSRLPFDPKEPDNRALIKEGSFNRKQWEQLGGAGVGWQGSRREVEGRVWIDGKEIQAGKEGIFDLLPVVRRSISHSLALTELGLTPSQASSLLTLPQREPPIFDGLVDASDRMEMEAEGLVLEDQDLGEKTEKSGGVEGVVLWWNNLETDSRYKKWRSDLKMLLRQQPGQVPQLKRNLLNVIVSVDLSTTFGMEVLIGPVNQFINRGLGIRFGMVEVLDGEAGVATRMARLTRHLVKTYGRASTMQFLSHVVQSSPTPDISLTLVEKIYARFIQYVEPLGFEGDRQNAPRLLSFVEVISEAHEKRERATYKWIERLDLKGPDGGRLTFVNGKAVERTETQAWIRALQVELSKDLVFLTERIEAGHLADTVGIPVEVANYFYDLPQTSNRRTGAIFEGKGADESRLKVANMNDVLRKVNENSDIGQRWIYPDGSSKTPLSIWIAGDLDSEQGLGLVWEALVAMQSTPFRLSFLHKPKRLLERSSRTLLSTLLFETMHDPILGSATPSTLLEIIDKAEIAPVHESSTQPSGEDEAAKVYWEGGRHALGPRGLDVADGEVILVVNGRIIKSDANRIFDSHDYEVLLRHELHVRAEPIVDALEEFYDNTSVFDRTTYSNLVAFTSSTVSQAVAEDVVPGMFGVASASTRSQAYELFRSDKTSFEIGHKATALLRIVAIMDPATEFAQKWSTTLRVLSEMNFVYVKVILLPSGVLNETPLKRFYRLNLQSKVTFEDDEQTRSRVSFQNLPQEPIFTLGVETPPSWLVTPKESVHDLDNLKLIDLTSDVEPVFELRTLVVEGHARETKTGSPPRGLQIELTDSNGQPMADTSVMANLGYFQLKANPGVLSLRIREGRGREIYELASVGTSGWQSPPTNETGPEVPIYSFSTGLTIYPQMSRKMGKELDDVLEIIDVKPSFLNSLKSRISSLFGSKTDEIAPIKKNADINIFTVASGLLYERFAYIMAISVMRHTNSTVKFWFIENFLSPSFLEFIPHLAKEYGFEYELVTYKWPSWLTGQKEKQRLIWGYKILFLDVLFPMDLNKVIFVDADQIVRTDLKELVDEDLHGAPYAYAPMGDDREEVEGFRFWKTGYWKEALRGRPYHISALYAVDLDRFRQIAAGDRLRGQYQGLSQDPNSLANLDQDLPNSMQDQLRIHTLDKSWLWCATWCSAESLKDAKTIDLCQDPQTKEPKLARARRIPEWEVYDSEVASLAARLSKESVIRSGPVEIDKLDRDGKKSEMVEEYEQSDHAHQGEADQKRDEL